MSEIERDSHLHVVSMSKEAALAFFGLTEAEVVAVQVEELSPADRKRYQPGAKCFAIQVSR